MVAGSGGEIMSCSPVRRPVQTFRGPNLCVRCRNSKPSMRRAALKLLPSICASKHTTTLAGVGRGSQVSKQAFAPRPPFPRRTLPCCPIFPPLSSAAPYSCCCCCCPKQDSSGMFAAPCDACLSTPPSPPPASHTPSALQYRTNRLMRPGSSLDAHTHQSNPFSPGAPWVTLADFNLIPLATCSSVACLSSSRGSAHCNVQHMCRGLPFFFFFFFCSYIRRITVTKACKPRDGKRLTRSR
ncbi:hypothetical protein IWZ03DRAFT_224461 [Phyllosticta citriasiana]|uniref:Uncharacterized protein n=1 Tax=Phyllosticta citriasiana TaxID=595635 RepID=A0ABR1KMA5_9PEZI